MLLLGALTLWSLVPLALLFGASAAHTGVFNGSDGLQVDDHLQYLAWVREGGQHLLLANPFQIGPDAHLFLDPMLALSGLLWRAGVSVQLSYLVWKPVAILVLFGGFAAYTRRLLGPDRWVRMLALLAALFFFSPALWIVQWFGLGGSNLHFGTEVMALEMFAGGYLWGGYSGAIAVGLMPVFLLGVERVLRSGPGHASSPEGSAHPDRSPGRGARFGIGPIGLGTGLAGMLVSWLHPWQGLVLLVMVGALIVWGRLHRRYLLLSLPVVLTAAPLAYYVALSHTASSWGRVSQPNGYSHLGLWLVLGLVPLALALPGMRRVGNDDTQGRLLRLWPLAALAVYFGLRQTWFYHAFVGLSLPTAILAMRAARTVAWGRTAAAIVIALLTVPGMIWTVSELDHTSGRHFLGPRDAAALGYLNQLPVAGGVLAPQELGVAVPAFTGRNTWVGHYYWTPDYRLRVAQAAALFDGRLTAAQAQGLVRASGARFLVSDCRRHADLRPLLGSLVLAVRSFGCASVYQLRPPVPTAAPPKI